jgi:hypothetical protein
LWLVFQHPPWAHRFSAMLPVPCLIASYQKIKNARTAFGFQHIPKFGFRKTTMNVEKR